MRVVKAENASPIDLGRWDEKNVTRVEFNLTPYINLYGEGVPQLTVKKPGDPLEYAAPVEREGNVAVWVVGREWLTKDGHGKCQLFWHVTATGGVAKSPEYKLKVSEAMGMSDETAKEPYAGYLAQVQAAGVQAQDGARRAERAAQLAEGYTSHPPAIGENGNWWLWNGEDYVDSGVAVQWERNHTYGLPVLSLTGDVSAMTKDNAVTLSYVYGDRSGTCSCKWQGSSSLSYPKKNYTIKFDSAFEAVEGWGEQKKYCLKANFIDHSHARNVVSGKLWGQIVKARTTVNEKLNALPNGGAIDGFPCIIELNGEFHGLYTWNIPKDGWMFGMGDGNVVTETEVLAFDAFVGYNGFNAATGEYTPTAEVTTSQTRKKNTLDGGRSYVNWDTAKMQHIGIRAYLFDANGNTSKVFAASNGNTANPVFGQSGGDFGSDCWLDVGTTASEFFNLTEPFSVPVPAGHTIRWFFGIGGETTYPDGTLTNAWSAEAEANNTWSYTWMKTGIGATMVKQVEAQEAIFCADTESNATYFRAEATLSGDFELEYATDEDNAGWALTSLNRLIRACFDSDGTDLDTTIARYLDWDSAIDYYIYTCLLGGADMAGKNYLLSTYDGTKWFFSAYDMDSTFGLWWNGRKFLRENHYPTVQWYANYHTLMNLILTHKKGALKSRYTALRDGVLSEGNVAESFCNFVSGIPSPVLDEDVRKWPTIPSSSVSNVAQILNWYRMRVAVIDAEMNSL